MNIFIELLIIQGTIQRKQAPQSNTKKARRSSETL